MRVISNASSVTISWSAPFSLDVTGVDPDIWYSVLIYNVTDENNPTAILCTDCINITETHYTFTPDYLSPCHVYNFSVIPLNGAGQGESSFNATTIVVGDSGNISLSIIDIAPSSKSFCSVSLNVVGLGNVCHPILSEANKSFSDIHVVDEQVFLFLMLPANKRYFMYLSIRKGWVSATIAHLYFTTYDVQRLSVEERGVGGVLSSLRTQSQDTVSTTVPVPPSTYTVYGYALEENGLPNTTPAVILESQLTISKGATLVKSSQLLKDADITSELGSTTVIDCEFSEVYPEASCVLVYREYGSPLLTVVELSQLINFPVSITVDNPENYTYALFGKDSTTGTEEEPVICIRLHQIKHYLIRHWIPKRKKKQKVGEMRKTTPKHNMLP
ncbi:hypothetical protein GBAR_LOCUS5098 [Geodia barretti]|uniref:Fibronectin type-III domain-containing protein n=1 Tax=Geodia barretti TaxID=519541 RepID=A0AA35W3X9_GEOBA|nr:hypothetical protein GBAR_LOCUS5098 [Geodia barretti]